ncbi:MAG TPA: TIGR04282 family arsenosugar biosynthesis glycosyltransferase, partial [Chitinophagaceae bacterium]|nr:TIGR04282 family arsenosugar biosynthesis glycosyltransferase [Chitinophagaceae bacterium]
MSPALLLFVRTPERGKVKTRLAAAIGADGALAVYEQLLAHTHAVTRNLAAAKYVFYSEAVAPEDRWNEGYHKRLQATGDLGQRMHAAFREVFAQGHNRVCIIGSDCFELQVPIIEKAFALLETSDVVVGPARDGGYYLLGLKKEVKELFTGIDWSTEKVRAQTLARVQSLGLTYALLPELTDVDTVDDMPETL